MAVDERLGDGDDVVARRLAGRGGHGRVHAERLAHDAVEVRQLVELVHARRVRVEREELRAQLRMHGGRLRQREQAPCRRGARRLVARDEEPAEAGLANSG